MRAILVSLALLLAATSIAAAAPSLADREGRWACLPDDQTAPQVYVDFEEKIYRRCDQNICSEYDILSVQRKTDSTEVAFAPGAFMSADHDGHRYTETLKFGETIITSSGACTFSVDQPEPDALEKEETRQRG